MQKISRIRLATSVRVGVAEVTFLDSEKAQVEITYEPTEMKYIIKDIKTGIITWVHATNIQYVQPEIKNETKPKASTSSSLRATAAT
jgi:hypothetical protein